jgi:hypothetical protein
VPFDVKHFTFEVPPADMKNVLQAIENRNKTQCSMGTDEKENPHPKADYQSANLFGRVKDWRIFPGCGCMYDADWYGTPDKCPVCKKENP